MKRMLAIPMIPNKKQNLLILFDVLIILLLSTGCRNQIDGSPHPPISGKGSPLDAKADDAVITFSELGYPAVQDEILLQRKAYVASYNPSYLIPNWVAWELTADHADGPWPRDHNYYEDLSIPEPRPTNEDYYGVGSVGLSRGHMCPAADCKWDSVAMAETNLMTNICPQEAGLNSGMWNQIEQACRRWAIKYDRIYIVCGPLLYRQEHLTIGDHNVIVPEAFFKVVLRLGDDPACIGYVMKNGSRGKKKSYVNTLAQVERITGYRFFPNLNDSIRSQIEDIADENMW